MPSLTIIKHFNIFKNALPGFCPHHVSMKVHMLCLQRMKKTLCCSIVIAVTFPAHALSKTISLQDLEKIRARILNSLVRVKNTI